VIAHTDAEKTDAEKNVATKVAMNAKRLDRAFKVRERRNNIADLQLCSGGAARASGRSESSEIGAREVCGAGQRNELAVRVNVIR
jgi:hypothetical protein